MIGEGIMFNNPKEFKKNKCEALNLLYVFKNIAELKLAINVTCTFALASNYFDSTNFKSSDIVISQMVNIKFWLIFFRN